MWILILIVLAVVVYFVVSQSSSSNQASKVSSRTQASKASSQNYTNQVDYSNLEVSLDSDIPVDYTRLRDLLAEGKWKEADEETGKMMLWVGNVTVERKVRSGEYKYTSVDSDRVSVASAGYFPCKDLCTIDRLWLKYSNGRFGFSVQKRIMSELGEDTLSILCFEKKAKIEDVSKLSADFRKRIGWYAPYSDGSAGVKNYNDLTFAIHAPYGHLPTAYYWDEGRGGLWKTEPPNDAVLLFVLNRFSICGIAM